MSFILIATNVPPNPGGPSSQFYDLVKMLVSQHSLKILFPFVDVPEDIKIFLSELDVEYRIITPQTSKLRNYMTFWSALESMRQENPKVSIFAQTWNNNYNIISGIFCKRYNLIFKIKLTGLCREELHHNKVISMVSAVSKDIIIAYLSNKIWVTSNDMLNKLSKSAQKKSCVIPNYINKAFYKKNSKPKTGPLKILTVARLRPWKNIEQCLEYFEHLEGKIEVSWTLVGKPDSDYGEAIAAEIDRLNQTSDNCIKLLDVTDAETMSTLYSEHEIFCLFSAREPFGIVFVEAMAVGLLVLGSPHGAIPEVLGDGERGIIIKDNNVEKIMETFTKFRCGKYDHIREVGTNFSQQLTFDNVSSRLQKEFLNG